MNRIHLLSKTKVTEGTTAIVHSLFGAMCFCLCFVQSSQLKVPRLPDYGEHLPDEFEFDGIQGLLLHVFILCSVS